MSYHVIHERSCSIDQVGAITKWIEHLLDLSLNMKTAIQNEKGLNAGVCNSLWHNSSFYFTIYVNNGKLTMVLYGYSLNEILRLVKQEK